MKKQKRAVSFLLSLTMMASLLTPAFAAEEHAPNTIWSNLEGGGTSEVTLQVIKTECSHENKHYQDNGDGTHDHICDDCGDVLVDDEAHEDLDNDGGCDKCGTDVTPPGCSHNNGHYADNEDGKTHDKICDGCGEVLVDDEAHEDLDNDGGCDKCGAGMEQPGCSHGNDRYVDNEDGETHKKVCGDCDEVLIEREPHEDDGEDDFCDKCGAKMPNGGSGEENPILIATVPLKLPIIMDLKGNITVADKAVFKEIPETVSYVSISRMQSALQSLTGSITFVNEIYTGTGGTDISLTQNRSVVAVVAGQNATVYGHKAHLLKDGNSAFDGFKAQSMDLRGLDTRKVTSMNFMFYNCSNLTSLDLSGFDTSI